MGTITIKSDKPDDLYFINELAQRLGLKSVIKTKDSKTDLNKKKSYPDYENTLQGILNDISERLKEARNIMAGKKKGNDFKRSF
jgi:hypothetical protein